MSFLKLFLVLTTILITSVVAFGQESRDGLKFECQKREEGRMQPCGPSPFELTRRFAIGYSPTISMGQITITNVSNRHVELELIEITPPFRPDDAEQAFWFSGVVKRKSAKRGEKMRISPTFVGHKRQASAEKYKWVNEGAYDGSMKFRNRTTNTIYEFKFTVTAFKPGKKT
jgi:hypothetical protein